jgi:hypothetical protein
MDLIGVGGLVLSAVGVGFSIMALIQAGRAKKAISKVIGKGEDQIARDDARALLAQIADARDATMARRQGASPLSSAGRSLEGDLQALQLAQNALATATVGSDRTLELSLRVAATEIEQALQAIASNSGRDGWADALGVLQGVIPKIDVLQRELGTKALR